MGIKKFFTDQQSLKSVSRHLKSKYNISFGKAYFNVSLSTFLFGSDYTEYEALHFYERTKNNKKTYLTVFKWLPYINKYNPTKYRSIFHDKLEFNTIFDKFLLRKWINLEKRNEQEIFAFFSSHNRIVLKNSRGCSGKQVDVIETRKLSFDEFTRVIKQNKYNLAEEAIENIDVIKSLNPTSLNTLRILTIHSDKSFNVLFACLRVGYIGGVVDNISRGGSSAKIDVETGIIENKFCCNEYRKNDYTQIGALKLDFDRIPFWNETIAMIKEASKLIPNIHIVGWDVAITPNGPAIIEGNESCDTAVMQYYNGIEEEGLYPRFLKMIRNI